MLVVVVAPPHGRIGTVETKRYTDFLLLLLLPPPPSLPCVHDCIMCAARVRSEGRVSSIHLPHRDDYVCHSITYLRSRHSEKGATKSHKTKNISLCLLTPRTSRLRAAGTGGGNNNEA